MTTQLTTTTKIERKVVEVKSTVVTGVQLDLTLEQAVVLLKILRSIGGDNTYSPRKYANEVRDNLQTVVSPLSLDNIETTDSNRTIYFRSDLSEVEILVNRLRNKKVDE